MYLAVYKGFDEQFLLRVKETPLITVDIKDRLNVLKYDRLYVKKLKIALLDVDNDSNYWILYEEFSLIKESIDESIEKDGLEVKIIRNNLFPDYYPIPFGLEDDVIKEILGCLDGNMKVDASDTCKKYLEVYNSLSVIESAKYGGFGNFEYLKGTQYHIVDYYPTLLPIEEEEKSDCEVLIKDDVDNYLRVLHRIINQKPTVVAVASVDCEAANRMLRSFKAYCLIKGIRLVKKTDRLPEEDSMEKELRDIATNDIGIKGFKGFRKIRFYKKPDIDNKTVEISQGQIIQQIIRQAENSYYPEAGTPFRDIFITASTGAGKSVMFQIPAVYLAKKYHKMTIIIEPVKALMQDQKEKLIKSGYTRVEAFNSDLITQVEKDAVLKRIKEGEIDLLYLSPETLLSYSIDTIIGDRDLGLLIVDEAHIVTTWGFGFRPDYWYLGGYINKLRNQIQTSVGKKRQTYKFPICAFTATAVNGGIDDTVSDTVISLYMENPIKYIGYVKRDNIGFDISLIKMDEKIPLGEYETEKTKAMNSRLERWLKNNEKTIVYFPYATHVGNAHKGVKAFAGIITDKKRIGTYTGKNIDDLSDVMFNDAKRQSFESFRDGRIPVMYATNAFGMGVDVDDVQNVYHYAVTGNLCDYVQEIGRAARKASMHGCAMMDFFDNDFRYMKALFGMSQIRQYQVSAVLAGIYNTYKNRNGARSFLISPESFTYIFGGTGKENEDKCVNKLKTCLLMLEKDFYDKYNFKVLISRPQSVFTKAFVCVRREDEDRVLNSKYGKYFTFVQKGRYKEPQPDGSLISDKGDIYMLDLKTIWENFNPNISFPQFKFWYYKNSMSSPTQLQEKKVEVMPEIIKYFSPRQKVVIETRSGVLLNELRERILDDFEYIANKAYGSFKNEFFTAEEFAKVIRERFGVATSRIISNSLFDLVDPSSKCVKRRSSVSGMFFFSLAFGNFFEFMRRPIVKSKIMGNISRVADEKYSSFMSLASDEDSSIALKLLSIFDYITYEVTGGSEPEIFIRLNDPAKVRSIVNGNLYYSNNYVTKAKLKHERDIEILKRFFTKLEGDQSRWDYVEDYFLGHDVLEGMKMLTVKPIDMKKAIDKERSYPTTSLSGWADIAKFFDAGEYAALKQIQDLGVQIPEYIETAFKKSEMGNCVMVSWPSKNVLICQDETSERQIDWFSSRGWSAYRISDIPLEDISHELI